MGEARRKQIYRDQLEQKGITMALTPGERSALLNMIKQEIKDDLRQEMRSDEQASTPHTGDIGPSGDAGEMIDKLLTRLNSLHKRLDSLEKEEDLKSEGLKGADSDKEEKVKELAECSKDAMNEDKGEIEMPGQPKPTYADADFYADDMRGQPDHVIDAHVRNTISKIQARADRVHSLQNGSAPRPLEGEGIYDYKRRLVNAFKKFSPAFSKVDLSTIPNGPGFLAVENSIYADAETALKDPKNFIGDSDDLYERIETDATGRRISTFHSNRGPSSWMDAFSGSRRRMIGIKNHSDR